MLTDVVMPNLPGPKLAERIARKQPQMRVLFMSGYADDEVVRRGLRQESIALLQKPFTMPALLVKVRQVLDRPAP